MIQIKNQCFIKEASFIYAISTTAKSYFSLILSNEVVVKTQDYK